MFDMSGSMRIHGAQKEVSSEVGGGAALILPLTSLTLFPVPLA